MHLQNDMTNKEQQKGMMHQAQEYTNTSNISNTSSTRSTAMQIMVLNNAAVMRMRQHQMDEATILLRAAIARLPQLYAHEILTGSLLGQPSTSTTTGGTGMSQRTSTTQRTAEADSRIGTQEQQQAEENEAQETEDSEDQIGFVTGTGILNQGYRHTDSYLLPANDNVLVFYDRAFTFQQDNNNDAQHDLDFELVANKSSLSGMVFYNLALVHHIQGDITEAMNLYSIAHALLEQVKYMVNIEVHILILMGLVNNIGHIHASLCNHAGLQGCIDWLRQALRSEKSAVMDIADLEYFMHLQIVTLDYNRFANAA